MRLVEAAAFVGLGAVWGTAFMFIKIADEYFPPFTLVMFRLMLGGSVMLLMTIAACWRSAELRERVRRDILSQKANIFPKMLFMGLFNNAIPFVSVAYAEVGINSGVAAVMDSTIPLFSTWMAPLAGLVGERLTKSRVVGLLVGFSGVILVSLRKIIANDSDRPFEWADMGGYSLVILASASYAIASVFGRKYLSHLDPLPAATGQILSGFLFVAIGSLSFDTTSPPRGFDDGYGFLPDVTTRGWLAIGYLGIFSTCVAYSLYYFLISTIGSVKQTTVGYLLPVFGIVEGVIFLHEWDDASTTMKLVEVFGTLMIMGGIAVVTVWDRLNTVSNNSGAVRGGEYAALPLGEMDEPLSDDELVLNA